MASAIQADSTCSSPGPGGGTISVACRFGLIHLGFQRRVFTGIRRGSVVLSVQLLAGLGGPQGARLPDRHHDQLEGDHEDALRWREESVAGVQG